MARVIKEKYMPGTDDGAVTELEIANRAVARKAAAEGIVLLENKEQILPLGKGKKLALFGAGATQTIKGGTGSGDVNEREVISVYQGLKDAGYEIVNEAWLSEFDIIYHQSRQDWKDAIYAGVEEGNPWGFWQSYTAHQYHMPEGNDPCKTDADTAVYVISRIAGEGADRFDEAGDYYLSEREEDILKQICEMYQNVIVLINSGSIIDLGFMDNFENIKGLLLISQPGMEGGHAVADVMSGVTAPSGKLTDTWALKYENYPNSEYFSHNNGDVEKEFYNEGIYVGYRYFDTFRIPVRYPFGYGLSYTEFEINVDAVTGFALEREDARIILQGKVKNIGNTYAGKEVVQFYVSCPQEKMEKEYRRLAGYTKTKELAPGEEEAFVIEIPVYSLASYWEEAPGWVLESGVYGIFAGNSIADAGFVGSIDVEEDHFLVKTENICPLQEELEELKGAEEVGELRKAWLDQADQYPVVKISKTDLIRRDIQYGTVYDRISKEAWEFVDGLTEEQLIQLATGDPGRDQSNALGSAGISIPGSAAQTSSCAEKEGLPNVALADGPAGVRLQREYYVKDGIIQPMPFIANIEGGFLMKSEDIPDGEKRYQYCTAFPVGTMLAQTWNDELIQEVGRAAAKEMELFEITFWLAPGLNIHRNPLCGRNFEYYSEDPYLSGRMAAAMTNGVQSVYGCGTTIKHFACNNQEDNRMGSDSIVSERTMREIYLKGFEIAVKTSQPFSIMTSYNLINGIHAANNYDLCTKVARDEWDFHGVIMTDWTTTKSEGCTAAGCMSAGNDLVMPGNAGDHESIRQALADGTLSLKELKKSVAHLVQIIWISNQMSIATGNKAVDEIRMNFFLGDRIRDAGLLIPVGIESLEDISYGPYGTWNLLDVYRKECLKGHHGLQPVIVNMHGGGWAYGDKELYKYYCCDLANRGFTVVNYNYRLTPEYHFPASMEDTAAVFRWIAEHALEYELDVNNVFVVGDSAGGQMASMFLTLMTSPEYRKLFDIDIPYDKVTVRGVGLNCGVYDVKAELEAGGEDLFATYLGEAFKNDREKVLEQVNAVGYITKDFPPAYVMTAANDFLKDLAEPMADLLASQGVEVECHLYGEEKQAYMGHVFHCNLRLKEAILCNDDECEFFKEHISDGK